MIGSELRRARVGANRVAYVDVGSGLGAGSRAALIVPDQHDPIQAERTDPVRMVDGDQLRDHHTDLDCLG